MAGAQCPSSLTGFRSGRMKKLWRLLKRWLGFKPRWIELQLTRLPKEVLSNLCSDGDLAIKSKRPNPKVKELLT